MQCGIACLQMVCKHYGRNYSSEVISKICYATVQGVSLLSISEAANTLGLHTVCACVAPEVFLKAPMPCILHWDQEHFVVLYKIKRNKTFYIADPGKGHIQYNLEEFRKHWISTVSQGVEKGVAMFIETTPAFFTYNMDNKAGGEMHSFSFLFGYVKKYRKYFGQLAIGLVVASIIELILPFLTQSIVDVGIKNQRIDFIWLILIGQLILIVSSTAIDFIRRWLLVHISMRVNISLISDFFIKLLKLPMSFFDTKLVGDLIQRMSDHSRVNNFLTQQILSITYAIIIFSVFSIVLLVYNRLIFAIFLVGSLLYAGWTLLFLRRRRVLDYELFEQEANNNDKTYEFITSMQEIKLQDCEQRKRWDWEDTQADIFNVQSKSIKLQQTQEAGSVFINEVKNIIITVVSATSVINGNLTLGMMLAVQYIIGQLNSPVDTLMKFIYSLQDVKISLERINEIHRAEEEDNSDSIKISLANTNVGISLNNVMFKYDPHSIHKVIDNISFDIPCGKITAIVGASGSGKSTLIRLMLGYYPALEGSVVIGETNINNINKKWWRRQCGVVMQNGIIFSDSIARNIAIEDGDIDTQRLQRAAEIACASDFIMALPLKYNTKIGRDGVDLSQGQKQRILIARAVYKDPKFIFLDEATNSLDANNEREIVNNLDKFYQGRTVVIVAHRLSTVKNADQIIVLDHGRIAEMGKHETLTAKRGVYYKLVKNQLELGE